MRYLFVLIAASFTIFSHAKAQEAPVVIELFTSQSCSSCPPADRLLGELAEQENIIALSCNVTYWNHLHWKDTLSRQFCTDRQYEYSASLNRRGVFTPQMIVNGTQSAVGSRRGEVKRAIKSAKSVLPINVSINEESLSISLPDLEDKNNIELYLVEYQRLHTQNIPSGENRGRTVDYTNPVKSINQIKSWDGTQKSLTLSIDNPKTGYAVIAQKGKTGPIVAAGKI